MVEHFSTLAISGSGDMVSFVSLGAGFSVQDHEVSDSCLDTAVFSFVFAWAFSAFFDFSFLQSFRALVFLALMLGFLGSFEEAVLGLFVFIGRSAAGVSSFVESSAFNTVAELLGRLGVGIETFGALVLEEEVSEFRFFVVVRRSTAGVVGSFLEGGSFNSVAEFLG